MKKFIHYSQNDINKDNNKLKYVIIVSIASIVIAIVIKIKQNMDNENDEEPMLQYIELNNFEDHK